MVDRPHVFIRDANRVIVGELPQWRSIDLEIGYNAAGKWTVVARDEQAALSKLVKGGGLAIRWDENITVAGRMEERPRDRKASPDQDSGAGTRTLTGSDGLAVIANELLFPFPTGTTFLTACQGAAYDVRNAPAETVIKGFVSANVGVDRPSWRNDGITGLDLLTVATDQGRGQTVKYSARFEPALDVLRILALNYQPAGTPPLGFVLSVTEDPNTGQLIFETTPQRDLTATAVYSWAAGNLTETSWNEAAPTVTHAVVGGSGDLTARVFQLVKDTQAAQDWRQPVWQFVDDSSTSDTTEMTQSGQDTLNQGQRSGLLSATCVDTPKLRFGEHVQIGDLVTVEVEPGVGYQGTVSKANLHAESSGARTVSLTVSPYGVTGDTTNDALVLYKRVDALERTLAKFLASR